MKPRKFWILLLILLCLLSGCRRSENIPLKVVQWIHVEGSNFYNEDNRYFYEAENLDKLLLAVRLMGQAQNPTQDPNALNSPEFRITMCYNNGTLERMYVKGDRYSRAENGPWRQVNFEKMAPLHYLLHFLPGDSVS